MKAGNGISIDPATGTVDGRTWSSIWPTLYSSWSTENYPFSRSKIELNMPKEPARTKNFNTIRLFWIKLKKWVQASLATIVFHNKCSMYVWHAFDFLF
jgi:hypothetical protein